MHYAAITIILIASFLVTLRRGPGAAFVFVYLPVLLILGAIRPVQINKLPDIYSTMAVSYGAILGMIVGGRMPMIRPHLVDFIVLACSITVILTGVINGVFWTFVSATGAEVLKWLVPYYMARVAFRDASLRRRMCFTFCYIAMALAAMGSIEFRLWPFFFSRMFSELGLSTALNEMAYGRGGFFRAMVTADHPIDFGNMGLILAGLIPMMAVTGGVRLKSWQVLLGVASCAAIVVESISFSSFAGFFTAIAIFIVLRFIRGSEWLLVPGVVGVIIGAFLFTQSLLSVDREAIKPVDSDAQLRGSYYIRVLIVQRSWETYGNKAGLLGFGDDNISKEVLQLESVDNSYMLFLMRRGWSHLLLRLSLGVMIAYLGTVMLRRAKTPAQRIPPAAVTAVLLGTMTSMYTVWFGFVYAVLWTMALAMTVTMRQMIAGKVTNESAAPQPALPSTQPYGMPATARPYPTTAHPA